MCSIGVRSGPQEPPEGTNLDAGPVNRRTMYVEARRRKCVEPEPPPASAAKKNLPGSHLRAEAPVFSPEELPRPANLRNLKTQRQNSRLEALDLVPFTPSQGVLTPSPNNFAAAVHEQQMYAVYPATPQAKSSMQQHSTEQSSVQSGSDESCGQSLASAFSPFGWPMPVSPTAFPVRQGQFVVGPLLDAAGQPSQYQTWMSSNSQEMVYPFTLQQGSPVYISPESPLVSAAWNRQPFQRHRSRLSGPLGAVFVMSTPGSPMYAGVAPPDYSHGVAMTVFPMPGSPTYGSGGGQSSPMWSGAMPIGPFSMQPETPPPNPHGGGTPRAFPRPAPLSPELGEQSGAATPEKTGIHSMPGGNSSSSFTGPLSDVPRMNARQRRTLRRAQEREAKQRAEQEARERGDLLGTEQQTDAGSETP